MKCSFQQRIRNSIQSVKFHLQDAMLTAAIQDRKVIKLDFTGSDLRLHMEGGQQWIFSAVPDDDGKPTIEFAYTANPPKAIEDYSI